MIDIIPRSEWGARPPKSVSAMHPTRRDRIFGHWPAMPGHLSDIQMLQSAQRYHMDTLGWSDIAYTVALGMDGAFYDLRGVNVAGGHTKGETDDSYAILFLLGTDEKPPAAMLEAVPHAIEWLRVNDPLLGERSDIVVMGHRRDDQASTACPGNDLDAFLWDYNHARDYPGDTPAPEPTPEPPADDANVQFIVKLYADILDREPDDEGLAYWVGQMNSGTPMGAISHEFLTVRLAADKQAMTALREGLAKTVRGGVDSAKAAELAYNLFLDNLLALKS